MVRLTERAERQLADLERYYLNLDRPTAAIRLAEAIAMAAIRIEESQGPTYPSPRPYPSLARYGWRWIKSHRYWIGFARLEGEAVITAIFHESANIPHRI